MYMYFVYQFTIASSSISKTMCFIKYLYSIVFQEVEKGHMRSLQR